MKKAALTGGDESLLPLRFLVAVVAVVVLLVLLLLLLLTLRVWREGKGTAAADRMDETGRRRRPSKAPMRRRASMWLCFVRGLCVLVWGVGLPVVETEEGV